MLFTFDAVFYPGINNDVYKNINTESRVQLYLKLSRNQYGELIKLSFSELGFVFKDDFKSERYQGKLYHKIESIELGGDFDNNFYGETKKLKEILWKNQ